MTSAMPAEMSSKTARINHGRLSRDAATGGATDADLLTRGGGGGTPSVVDGCTPDVRSAGDDVRADASGGASGKPENAASASDTSLLTAGSCGITGLLASTRLITVRTAAREGRCAGSLASNASTSCASSVGTNVSTSAGVLPSMLKLPSENRRGRLPVSTSNATTPSAYTSV